MPEIRGLLKAAHFGPTILVTTIAITFSAFFKSALNSVLIGLTIFLGQLIVGWTNDLIDFEDDLLHQRLKKPLVSKQISKRVLTVALAIDIPIALLLNILGPLKIKGGLISIIGILIALSYNFYFKFTLLSLLPYALAFGALPCAIVISANQNPKAWMWLAGSLFGIGAHFINVIKDLAEDRASGIHGLPQVLGKKKSIIVSAVSITIGFISLAIGLL